MKVFKSASIVNQYPNELTVDHISVTDSMYEVTLVKEDIDGNTSVAAMEFYTSSAPLPPAPTNLVTTFISSDSLGLEWYQPQSDMEILHYTVKYYELLSGDVPGMTTLQTR